MSPSLGSVLCKKITEKYTFEELLNDYKIHELKLIAKRNGIDIQEISKKSLRISSKFINQHIQNLTKEKCTLIWAIKEAVFKWHRKGSVDFKKDIQVPDFNIAEKPISTLL